MSEPIGAGVAPNKLRSVTTREKYLGPVPQLPDLFKARSQNDEKNAKRIYGNLTRIMF